MLEIVNILTIIIGSVISLKSAKKIIKGEMNLYRILVLIFFIFQYIPLIVGLFFNPNSYDWSYAPNIGKAYLNDDVSILYDIYIAIIIIILYRLSKNKDTYIVAYANQLQNVKFGLLVDVTLMVFMLSPIIGILLAPNPSIYLEWAYFYTNQTTFFEELYHNEVMKELLWISLASSLVYYTQMKKKTWITYLVIIFVTFLSFKRTLLVFGCILVLFIDFFSNKNSNKLNYLFKKTLLMMIVCIGYFISYVNGTGKGEDTSNYITYTMYFGREYPVKVAILDLLNGSKMLNYPGESVLFDFFFFLPRSIWPEKPAMYTKYLTAYSKGTTIDDSISTTNYYANIWAECLSNFNVYGIFYAFLIIFLIKKISEKSNNIVIYLLGFSFIIFYFIWGIQPFTMLIIGLWATCLLLNKIGIVLKKA